MSSPSPSPPEGKGASRLPDDEAPASSEGRASSFLGQRTPTVLAAASAALVAALYVLATGTSAGVHLDASGVVRLDPGSNPVLYRALSTVLNTIDLSSLALLGGGLVAWALARGKRREAFGAVAVILGANATTQVLKPLLGFLDPLSAEAVRGLANSFPSGHATVAMSLGLAFLLVAPQVWRRLAALAGWAYSIAVGAALLALGWHYPSDVAGGYLIATAWAGAAAAGISTRRPSPERSTDLPPTPVREAAGLSAALFVASAFLVGGAVAVAKLPGLLFHISLQPLFFAAVGGLTAVSAALFAAGTAALQRL